MAIEESSRLDPPPASRSGPSRHLVFAVVAIGLFMSSIDSTIVATALPAIHRSLHATINWAGWSITIYSLGMVIVLPLAGKISDQFGRRRVFLYGVRICTLGSVLCGFSTGIYMLVGFRAIQAVGGAALQPSAAGIVAEHFGANRDRAIGMFGTIASGGQVIGPLVGGVLVGYLSWRWIFFVNIPIGVVLLGAIVRVIPESARLARTRTDIRGLALMGTFVLAANLGITNIGNRHTALDAPIFVGPEVIAIALLYLFVRHTRGAADPFIPMRLIRAKGFAVMNSLNLLWGIVGFGVASLVPLYAEQRYHLKRPQCRNPPGGPRRRSRRRGRPSRHEPAPHRLSHPVGRRLPHGGCRHCDHGCRPHLGCQPLRLAQRLRRHHRAR
jgi:MFS family permease